MWAPSTTYDIAQLLASVKNQTIRYRERFLIPHRADEYLIVPVSNVSHITIRDGVVRLCTLSGDTHALPMTLEEAESQLDPKRFMRVHLVLHPLRTVRTGKETRSFGHSSSHVQNGLHHIRGHGSHSSSKQDPCVCYATSKTVDGEFIFKGPLLYKGEPIRRWDIGSFVDDDGHGNLLVHHGSIYRLSTHIMQKANTFFNKTK